MPAERTVSSERPIQELAVLNEIIGALTSTLEFPELLRIVLSRIKMLTSAEAISLLLYDAERDELVFAATETLRERGMAEHPQPEERGLAAWVASTGESAIVNDRAADPRCAAAREPLPPCEGRHLLAVPVKRGERVIGVIEVADRYDGLPFSDADQRAIERTAATLCSRGDPEEICRDSSAVRGMLAALAAEVPTQAAVLLLYDPAGRGLLFTASRCLEPGVIDGLRMRADRGIAGWVARHRQALRLDDASRDPRYDPSIESETHFRPGSMLCVPLVSKDVLLGVIQVINRIGRDGFDEEELRLVQILADYAAIAIEHASLYRRAQQALLTDDLTGLGNTRHLNRLLPELIARGRPLCVLVLDFDNFKTVVDTYGHLIGARTIAAIGSMMGSLIRPGDFAARFGGDEFVVVMPDSPIEAALSMAETLRAAIADFASLEGHGDIDISGVTASIGVAAFPQHAGDADGLLRAADAAMYTVKRSRKNGIAVARPGMSMSER